MLLHQLLFSISLLTSIAIAFPTPTPATPATLLPRETTSGAPSTSTTGIEFTSTEHITIAGETDAHLTLAPHTITIAIPTCSQTITPDKNGYVPPGTCNALWDYYPSFAAAVIFAILFFTLTSVHIYQAVIYKKVQITPFHILPFTNAIQKFSWVLIMGTSWETVAFTFRTISTRQQQNVGVYLVFQIFILLAPLWINAFDYMVLGRMIHFFLPEHALFGIPASTLAVCFVALDFVSFIVQLVGGSLAGPMSPVEQQLMAIHVYMGGIGLQQFFILVFVGLAVKFQIEMNRVERAGVPVRKSWRPLLFTLYITLGLITIRIMFRLIEFSSGRTSSNPLPYHEAYFYVLEAVPMLLAVLSFNIVHPGSVLVGLESERPSLKSTFKGMRQKRKMGRLLNNSSDELALI